MAGPRSMTTFHIRSTRQPARRIFALLCASAIALLATGCILPAQSGSIAVWAVSDTRELAPDSEPLPESEVFSASGRLVRLTAAINETVAFQLAVRAGPAGERGGIDVNISDFNGPRGLLPAAAVVSLARAQFVPADKFRAWYPAHTGKSTQPRQVADILVPWNAPRGGGPMQLDGSQTGVVWVDLFVPPTTEPGDYRATLQLSRQQGKQSVYRGEVLLRVRPVVLPVESASPVICRVDARGLLSTQINWSVDTAEETRLLPGEPSHQAAVKLVESTMRLLHAHRTTPVLANSFPKYRVTNERSVEIDWTAYDALVSAWLDGSAFPDRSPLQMWLLPASADYPAAARGGGFDSPRYARLLAAYLAGCQKHFEQKGWLNRSVARLVPPDLLTSETVDRARRAAGIVRQSEARFPVVTHLPVRTLRGLGWFNAPTVELPDASIWSPPAEWFEPDALLRARGVGQRTWFAPGDPPYSGSLAVEAPPTDPRELPWQAARYGAQALWIENAAAVGSPARPDLPRDPTALVYPGVEFGLIDEPIASARLKRLRRGIQDVAMVQLLEQRGKARLAQRTAEQLVRWAFTDAAGANLLATRDTGWSQDPYAYWLARELLLAELSSDDPTPAPAGDDGVRLLADWGRLMTQNDRVALDVQGVRLSQVDADLRARVRVGVSNATQKPLLGRLSLPALPAGWRPIGSPSVAAAPGGQAATTMELALGSVTFSASGTYPFSIVLESDDLGSFEAAGRLAVAACPVVQTPPRLDGDLGDWPSAPNNSASDFRLVRGDGAITANGPTRAPTLPTQAFFCTDQRRLYVGIYCALAAEERPQWEADNTVPVDGAMPWGQDVVEILLSPRNTQTGGGGDIYCLQVKPSGVVVGRRGCLTDPPMNPSEPWQHAAEVAVRSRGKAWVVELAIPLSAFDAATLNNRVWGANVTRLDAKRGEYSSWSGARGTCYLPELLGNLIFAQP